MYTVSYNNKVAIVKSLWLARDRPNRRKKKHIREPARERERKQKRLKHFTIHSPHLNDSNYKMVGSSKKKELKIF